MRLLDLFCGVGGAAMGYFRAGFTEIVGVDIKPRHYPFTLVLGNALEYLAVHGGEFDAIHASPPCQLWARTAAMHRIYAQTHYQDWLSPTRAALSKLLTPWIIENVPGAPGPWDLMLCGTMFGLRGCNPVRRHRYFQASFPLDLPPFACSHIERAMNVYDCGPARKGTEREFCDAMGVGWGTTEEGLEAIPPVYTEYIGKQLLAVCRAGGTSGVSPFQGLGHSRAAI